MRWPVVHCTAFHPRPLPRSCSLLAAVTAHSAAAAVARRRQEAAVLSLLVQEIWCHHPLASTLPHRGEPHLSQPLTSYPSNVVCQKLRPELSLAFSPGGSGIDKTEIWTLWYWTLQQYFIAVLKVHCSRACRSAASPLVPVLYLSEVWTLTQVKSNTLTW